MTQPINLCGVILAAGKSSRMGTDKALLAWPPAMQVSGASSGQTLLSAGIDALKPVTDAVIVVAGKNLGNLAPITSACGVLLVENPDPDRGQFSSLRVGLREAIGRGYDAAMITPVDCPPLGAESLGKLQAAFLRAAAAGMWGVAPENQGRHGHPLVANRALIDALLSAPETSNAREVKRLHERMIEFVPVAEPLMRVDLNTPEQYAAWPEGSRSASEQVSKPSLGG